MAVKILIKRKFKSGSLKEASQMLIRARSNAMGHNGYISSETLSNFDDPNTVIVVSMWQRLEDWNTYKSSPERRNNEEENATLLETPTQYETFNLGLQT